MLLNLPAVVPRILAYLTLILGPKIHTHSGFGVFFHPRHLSVIKYEYDG